MRDDQAAEPIESVESLRAELAASRTELSTLRSSLRFQIGDAIVGAVSGRASMGDRLRALLRAVKRARALAVAARIRNDLFLGLPNDGLAPTPDLPSRKELLRLRRYVDAAARGAASTTPAFENSWASSAARTTRDLAGILASGYELPPRPAEIKRPPERPHILYVSRHDPLTASNGYARRSYEIVRSLVGEGARVTVAVTAAAPSPADDADFPPRLPLPLSDRVEGLAGYVDALADQISGAARNAGADIIHAASNYLIGLAAITAARRLGLPCVYELRGLWELTRLTVDPNFAGSLGYRIQSRLEAACAEEADAAIAGSTGIEDELRRRGVLRDRIHVAESGGPDLPPDLPLAAKGRSGPWGAIFPEGSKVLGFAGSITSYEGFDTMAAALRRLREDEAYRLLILGDGPYASSAKALFDRAGVADRVHFAGRVARSDVTAAYGVIELILCPRQSSPVTRVVEALKPVEALAAGVPVVVSDLEPFRQLRAECPGVIEVRAGDADDLADKISAHFALAAEVRSRLGVEARQWIGENRSWKHTARRILDAYRAIGDKAPPEG